MELSKREKILLVILFVVILFYTYYNYLYLPKYEELIALREKFEENSGLMRKTEKALKNNEEIQNILESIKLKYNELENTLPSTVHQEEILVLLKGIMDSNDIQLRTVGYSTEQEETNVDTTGFSVLEIVENYEKLLEGKSHIDLSNYFSLPENKTTEDGTENTEDPSMNNQSVKFMDVSISFTSSYENLKKALVEMEQGRRKIIIKSLSLGNSNEEVAGNMVLSFPYYELEGASEPIEWPFIDVYGNTNPFKDVSGYVMDLTTEKNNLIDNKKTEDEKGIISTESDFYIILKPFSGDLPTVYIGKYPYRYSEIYAKKQESEKVRITIKEENKRFFFRYNNSMDAYPAGKDQWEEFVPFNNRLLLSILSMPRLNGNDYSGVLLDIVNESTKPLDIKIFNDDLHSPRVKIQSQSGLINIENMES